MKILLAVAGAVMAMYITANPVEWYMPCVLWFSGTVFGYACTE